MMHKGPWGPPFFSRHLLASLSGAMVSRNSKDPGIFTHVLLFLIGAGIGGTFLYYGVRAHLNGDPLTSPPVVMALGLGTAAVAGGLYALVDLLTGEPAVPEEAPWTVRPEWQTNRMTSQTSSEGISLFWATVWNVLAWPLAGFVFYDAIWTAADPNWLALLVLLFPVVGLGFGWVGLKKGLRRWTFGTSTLLMDTMPGRLGGRIEARLQAPISFDEKPREGFEVHLSCFRRYKEISGRSKGRRLLWRDEKRLQGQPSPEGDGQVEVPISFEVPADKPPSTPRKTTERIQWEIGISAELEGLDYEVSFEIPVFQPSAAPSPTSEAARPETAAEDAGSEAPPSKPSSPAAPDREEDFTEPVSRGIHLEDGPGNRLVFSFAAGRAKEITVPIAATGLLCLVVGTYLLALPHLVGAFSLLFGAVFGYVGWLTGTRASTITIDEGRIEVMRGPLGRKTTEQMRCEALGDVQVKAKTEVLGTAYYSLILESGRGSSQAWDSGRPGTSESGDEPPIDAFANELREAAKGKRITVAEWLTNKQEADWIAARIRRAAGREASRQGQNSS